MTFQPFDLNSLPARNRGPRVDLAEANALLAIVTEHGAASDGQTYEDAESARTAGMRAVRLLSHVVPVGKRASVRTFPVGEGKTAGFGYAVALKDAKPAKSK